MRIAFVWVLAVSLVAPSAGCLERERGTLLVEATDGPGSIDDFESVLVTVTHVLVHGAGRAGEADEPGNESGGGWHTFPVEAARQTMDLARLLDGNTTQLLNHSLSAGKYTQLRLRVSKADGTLKNGMKVAIEVPGETLKIPKPFRIEAGQATTFVADIHVVKNARGYQLEPNVGSSVVREPAAKT